MPLSDSLKPFLDRGVLTGTVTLTGNRTGILSHESAGFAHLDSRTPMQPDTVFWIASQTKPMTATALMMLVDEGLLTLDDPVEKHLPEFQGQWMIAEEDEHHRVLKSPSHPITVREILNHTAGLPFKSPMEKPTLDLLPLAVAVRSHAMSALRFEPGSRFEYSNAGTNTAGRIIEVLSGQRYEDFLEDRLLAPLGMEDTIFRPCAKQVARLAATYKPNADKTAYVESPITQLSYPLDNPRRQPVPGGGLFSTAADVGQFCRMILNGGILDGRRYVSESAVAQMTTKQTPEAVTDCYGLGWGVRENSFGHAGACSTRMTIHPGIDLFTVFLVQHVGYIKDGSDAEVAFQTAAEKQAVFS